MELYDLLVHMWNTKIQSTSWVRLLTRIWLVGRSASSFMIFYHKDMIHTVVTQQEANIYDGGSLATGKPDGFEHFEESE